jgi:hypothetical protein
MLKKSLTILKASIVFAAFAAALVGALPTASEANHGDCPSSGCKCDDVHYEGCGETEAR